jgi:hypothetical protein
MVERDVLPAGGRARRRGAPGRGAGDGVDERRGRRAVARARVPGVFERVENRRVHEAVAGSGHPQGRLDSAQQRVRCGHRLARACVEDTEFAAAVEAGQRAVHASNQRMDAQRVERCGRVYQDADVGPEGAETVVVLGRRHRHDVRVVTGAGAWSDWPEDESVARLSAAPGSPRSRRRSANSIVQTSTGRDQNSGRQAEHRGRQRRARGTSARLRRRGRRTTHRPRGPCRRPRRAPRR